MKKNGYTLIEILVAAAIIAVLSVVGVTSYTSINKRSRDARRKSDVEQVRSALEMYRTDNGTYPNPGDYVYHTVSSSLGILVTNNYLPALPADPKEDATHNYWYTLVGPGAYKYCICTNLESGAGSSQCAAWGSCNHILKNP